MWGGGQASIAHMVKTYRYADRVDPSSLQCTNVVQREPSFPAHKFRKRLGELLSRSYQCSPMIESTLSGYAFANALQS